MFTPSPRARAKERILAYGYMGSGKTYGWTEIAEMYRITDTPGTFYVISTEFGSADRALELYDNCDNVVLLEALDWDELHKAAREFTGIATGDDWLIVDNIAAAWQWCQDDHTQQRWGQNAKRYFGELENNQRGEINWQIVNDQYRQFVLPNVLRFPGHVYACSPGEELREVDRSGKDPEDARIRRLFGRAGLRPSGQKDLGYQFHSVLLFQSPTPDSYTITSIDDHARVKCERESVVKFPLSYLREVAGWQIT